MTKLVFISHSSLDRDVAHQVCSFLESREINCWISSRDIPGGIDWTEAIMDGITRCELLVMIFSRHSIQSSHVQREVQLAFERGVNVIPLKIDDCEPTKKLRFYFTGVQWVDAATRPIEPHLDKLAVAARLLLDGKQPTEAQVVEIPRPRREPAGAAREKDAPAPARRYKRLALVTIIAPAIAALLILLAASAWYWQRARAGRVVLGDHISRGEEIIRSGNPDPDMLSGTQAYARGDYALAADYFQRVWQSTRDQEALIYLNNASLQKDKIPSCTIAVVVPVSRTGGPSGDEILKGVAQAQNEVNQREGRIKDGVGLKIAIASDVFGQEDDFSRATQVATDLVDDRTVLGVIGHFSSDVTRFVIPIYQGRKALISPTSTAENLIEPAADSSRQCIFRTVYRDSDTARALVDYLGTRRDARGAAVFYSKGSVYCESLLKQFAASYAADGGQLPDDCVFDLASAAFDPDADLARAKARGAQILVLFPSSKSIDAAFQLLAEARQPEYAGFKLIVSGDSLGYVETLQRGATTNGLVSVVPWQADANRESQFFKDADKLWAGAPVVWQMALSYDATQCFVAAIARHLPASAPSVQAALAAPDFKALGATGPIRFANGNRVGLAPQWVQLQRVSESPVEYRFLPVGAAAVRRATTSP